MNHCLFIHVCTKRTCLFIIFLYHQRSIVNHRNNSVSCVIIFFITNKSVFILFDFFFVDETFNITLFWEIFILRYFYAKIFFNSFFLKKISSNNYHKKKSLLNISPKNKFSFTNFLLQIFHSKTFSKKKLPKKNPIRTFIKKKKTNFPQKQSSKSLKKFPEKITRWDKKNRFNSLVNL